MTIGCDKNVVCNGHDGYRKDENEPIDRIAFVVKAIRNKNHRNKGAPDIKISPFPVVSNIGTDEGGPGKLHLFGVTSMGVQRALLSPRAKNQDSPVFVSSITTICKVLYIMSWISNRPISLSLGTEIVF